MPSIVDGVEIERVVLVSEDGTVINLDMETIVSNGVTVWESFTEGYIIQNGVVVLPEYVYSYDNTPAKISTTGQASGAEISSGNLLKLVLKNIDYTKFNVRLDLDYVGYGSHDSNYRGYWNDSLISDKYEGNDTTNEWARYQRYTTTNNHYLRAEGKKGTTWETNVLIKITNVYISKK